MENNKELENVVKCIRKFVLNEFNNSIHESIMYIDNIIKDSYTYIHPKYITLYVNICDLINHNDFISYFNIPKYDKASVKDYENITLKIRLIISYYKEITNSKKYHYDTIEECSKVRFHEGVISAYAGNIEFLCKQAISYVNWDGNIKKDNEILT